MLSSEHIFSFFIVTSLLTDELTKRSIKLDQISAKERNHLFTTVLSKSKCYAPCVPLSFLPFLSSCAFILLSLFFLHSFFNPVQSFIHRSVTPIVYFYLSYSLQFTDLFFSKILHAVFFSYADCCF